MTGCIVEQMRGADHLITRVNHDGACLDDTWNVDTVDLIMQAGRPILVVPERTQK